MINTWYVLGIKDKNNKYGYSQITPKGVYYSTLEKANKRKHYYSISKKEVVVLKRTCEPLILKDKPMSREKQFNFRYFN